MAGIRFGAEDRCGDSHPRGDDQAVGGMRAPESGARGGQDAPDVQRTHERVHERAPTAQALRHRLRHFNAICDQRRVTR